MSYAVVWTALDATKSSVGKERKGNGESVPDFQSLDSLRTWTDVQDYSTEDVESLDNTANGLILTMGVMCTETGCARAVTRKYNENGALVTVSLKAGAVKESFH